MTLNQKPLAKEIGKTLIYFAVLYGIILYTWLHIEIYYNSILTQSVMNLFAWNFDFRVLRFDTNGSHFGFDLISNQSFHNEFKELFHYTWGLQHELTHVTYNIPMSLSATLAIIMSQSKNKKDYIIIVHILLLLISLHFLILFLESVTIATHIARTNPIMAEILSHNSFLLNDYRYFVKFLVKYGLIFEPYLMMIYVWVMLKGTSKNDAEKL